MSKLNTVADLFINYSAAPVVPLSLAEEQALIARAYSDGDQAAYMTLLEQYAPGLRSAFARIIQPIRASLSREDIEDLQMEAIMGFYEAIAKAGEDGDARVAQYLKAEVSLALRSHAAARIAVTVPARTLRRYNSIMAKAGNNLTEATSICGQYEMAPETLLAVHEAVNQAGAVELDAPIDGGEGVLGSVVPSLQPAVEDIVETHRLAQHARSSVEGRELDVVDMIYGFDPLEQARSEREAAGELGMSKTTVHRVHHSALSTMRSAVGIA